MSRSQWIVVGVGDMWGVMNALDDRWFKGLVAKAEPALMIAEALDVTNEMDYWLTQHHQPVRSHDALDVAIRTVLAELLIHRARLIKRVGDLAASHKALYRLNQQLGELYEVLDKRQRCDVHRYQPKEGTEGSAPPVCPRNPTDKATQTGVDYSHLVSLGRGRNHAPMGH